MKILILGVDEKRAHLVPSYPGLDIRISRSKPGSHNREATDLISTSDRIIAMTKFISHGAFSKLDRSKLTMIHGGMTRLKEVLQTLSTSTRLENQLPRIISHGEEADMARSPTVFDFSALKDAPIGHEVVFTKPNDMTVEKFISSMAQGRSYYKTSYGVLTSSEMSGGKGKCTIKVLPPAGKELEEARERCEEASILVAPVPAESQKVAQLAASAMSAAAGGYGRQFWEQAFFKALELNPGGGASQAVTCANIAHTAWMSRFGSNQPTAEKPD